MLKVLYVFLLKGEQPRNNYNPSFSDDNQENYHWWFLPEHGLEKFIIDYKRKDIVVDEDEDYSDDELYDITYLDREVIEVMKKHPIYFSNRLSYTDTAAEFQKQIALEMCKEMWDEIK